MDLLASKWEHIVPTVWAAYPPAFIDRVDIGIASLGMWQSPGFTDADLGLAAEIFFTAYSILEIPGTYIALTE
jgi:ACS family tartrate transporter-like MFS transporter